MATYRWTCLACGATNAPAHVCASCGFPAEATGEELVVARDRGVTEVYRRRNDRAKWIAEWRRQPLWIKAGQIVGLITVVIGVILWRLAPPTEVNFYGIALAVIGFVLLVLLKRIKRTGK